MTRFILKCRLLLFLVFMFSCKSSFFYDNSCRKYVSKFPYTNYVQKGFNTFYSDFKSGADKKGIQTVCELYQPKIIKVEGIRLQIGHGYSVKAIFKSDHYQHIWPDTTASCHDCFCPEYDTAKIAGFELLKDNVLVHSY